MKQLNEIESIYSKALKHFGRETQLNKVEEELTELLLAIKHYRLNKAKAKEVITEIADVKIVLNYIEMILQNENSKIDVKSEILGEILRKIDRLGKLIEKEK